MADTGSDTGDAREGSTEDDYHTDEVVTFKQRKGKFPRRTQGELALGFVIHLLMLFYWVFVHVYDGTIIKGLSVEDRLKFFPVYENTVGRWKFLTYINMVSEILFLIRLLMLIFCSGCVWYIFSSPSSLTSCPGAN